MKIPKPTDSDKEYCRSIVLDHPDVMVKPMFGNVAAFVNANMFMGLFGPDVGLRLAAADRESLLAVKGAGAFGPEDRPMKEHGAMPASWRDDEAATLAWVMKALDYTAAMPPK
jgi:hypothetical protein